MKSVEVKCRNEVKRCSDNIKLNSDYELIMLCKKCNNEVDCKDYIRRMKMKIVNDNINMKRNNDKRMCLENLKIVNEFYIMNEKLMIEERFMKRREMMKIKCDGRFMKKIKNMKSNYSKSIINEKLNSEDDKVESIVFGL